MPLYLFNCPDCGAEFETLLPQQTAAPKADCPGCGGGNAARAFGVPARVTGPAGQPRTNCRGDGPPCGAAWCGRGPAQG